MLFAKAERLDHERSTLTERRKLAEKRPARFGEFLPLGAAASAGKDSAGKDSESL